MLSLDNVASFKTAACVALPAATAEYYCTDSSAQAICMEVVVASESLPTLPLCAYRPGEEGGTLALSSIVTVAVEEEAVPAVTITAVVVAVAERLNGLYDPADSEAPDESAGAVVASAPASSLFSTTGATVPVEDEGALIAVIVAA